MARMFAFRKSNAATSSQDEELWDELRQALREQFPNVQRQGCPEQAVLARLAKGRMRLDEAEAWLDHFSRCSPCFRDFEQLQVKAIRRRRWAWALSAAAAVIVSSSLWLVRVHEKATQARHHPAPQPSMVAQVQPGQPPPIALNLENLLSIRQIEESSEANPPQLPRGSMSLSVYLPPGSQSGIYEIAFLRTSTDTVPLASFKASAAIEKGVAVLHATADTSGFEPGTYILAFRPLGGMWRYARVAIP